MFVTAVAGNAQYRAEDFLALDFDVIGSVGENGGPDVPLAVEIVGLPFAGPSSDPAQTACLYQPDPGRTHD
jgi:hypothetical protein